MIFLCFLFFNVPFFWYFLWFLQTTKQILEKGSQLTRTYQTYVNIDPKPVKVLLKHPYRGISQMRKWNKENAVTPSLPAQQLMPTLWG